MIQQIPDAPPAIVWHYPSVSMPHDLPNHAIQLDSIFTLSYTFPPEEIDLECVVNGRYEFYAYNHGAHSLTGRIPLVFTIPPEPAPLPPYDLYETAISNLCWLDVRPTATPGVFDVTFVAIPDPADIDRSGTIDSGDLLLFLNYFFEGDSAADFTLDDRVDSADFFEYLTRWFNWT